MTGKSFRGCLLYCLNDKLLKEYNDVIFKNRADIIRFNKCFGNQKELIQQFNEVRQLNMKLSKPVAHITLSFAKGEQVDKNKLSEISEACAKDLGFENNQYVAVVHKDTGHQHLHIVANRIGFNKQTVSDSNNYQKIANFCRKTELQYGLQQVLNPKKFLLKERRELGRHDERREVLKAAIKNAIVQSKHYEDFERIMKEKGYQVIKARGISFTDNKKVKFKGSEVGYSLSTIERLLQHQELAELIKPTKYSPETKDRFKQAQNNQQPSSFHHHKELSIQNNIQRDIAKTIEQLIKPEESDQHINHELLPKKKEKKKKWGLHL